MKPTKTPTKPSANIAPMNLEGAGAFAGFGPFASMSILAILLLAWTSSGIAPLRDAVAGAVAPSDFATDFVPAARIGRARSSEGSFPLEVALGNAEAVRLGAAPYANVGVPFGAHPPPAVLFVAALVPLGFSGAALAWLVLSLAALASVSWVAARALAVGDTASPGTAGAMMLFLALTIWPPVLHNIEKGQWSLIVAGLLAASWWAFEQRRDRLAGALIAIAAAFKVMPLLVLIAFAGAPAPRRRRVLTGAGTAGVVAVALSAATLGGKAWLAFFQSAPVNTRGWQTGPANTLSIWGALARSLVGGPFARPFVSTGLGTWVARIVWGVAAVGLMAAATRLTLETNNRPVAPGDTEPAPTRSFAAWCVLAVVLGPLSWSHAATLLVLPAALLGGGAPKRERPAVIFDQPPESAGPVGERPIRHLVHRLILVAACVALTIPRMTLFTWAGPVPVSPGRGLLLSTHMAAALAILYLALARRSGSPGSARPPI